MVDMKKIEAMAEECGFTAWGELDVSTLEFKQEVRDMCQANLCGMWEKSWSCPPACGSLEEMREKVVGYSKGVLVQTVGQMEDSFDFEVMMETAENHQEYYEKMWGLLEQDYPNLLAMGTGGCKKCAKCTYPDAPCRFPDRLSPSMEGCGLVVNDVCTKNGLKYNNGKNTICYTACFLLE